MCVDTMGRPRAGGLRVSAISIVAASAIGIGTLATAGTQTFEVPSNRQASQILPVRVSLAAGPTQVIHTDNRGHAMAMHSVHACCRAGGSWGPVAPNLDDHCATIAGDWEEPTGESRLIGVGPPHGIG